MGNGANVAADPDFPEREFERLQGALDAALVFTAAAAYHRQNGDLELAAACLSDATRIYTAVLAAFSTIDLTDAQIHELRAKLI